MMPRRKVPVGPSMASAMSERRSHSRSTARAWATMGTPRSVVTTGWWLRSNTARPRISSSLCTCMLSAGCETRQ
jgi:hypothetical protein